MHRGYIKIWRKLRDSFMWEDAQMLKLFIHLLMEANHTDRESLFNGNKIIIKRGQLICGRHQLELETGINESKIYRTLNILEAEQLIEQQKNNRYTLISIVKYSQYQDTEQQNEHLVNNQRTTSEQPVNTSKELKRINKNGKKVGRGFTPPTTDQIKDYCQERGNGISPDKFFDYYQVRGWVLKGGEKMKDWKAAVRNWERGEKNVRRDTIPESLRHLVD